MRWTRSARLTTSKYVPKPCTSSATSRGPRARTAASSSASPWLSPSRRRMAATRAASTRWNRASPPCSRITSPTSAPSVRTSSRRAASLSLKWISRRSPTLTTLPKHLQGDLHPSEWRAHLHPLHGAFHLLEHLARDRDALGERRLLPLVLRAAHPSEHCIGDRHARDLVREKLRVTQREQRPDPRHDRNLELPGALQEPLELLGIEHGLRHGELGAGVHLPREARQLAIEI